MNSDQIVKLFSSVPGEWNLVLGLPPENPVDNTCYIHPLVNENKELTGINLHHFANNQLTQYIHNRSEAKWSTEPYTNPLTIPDPVLNDPDTDPEAG